MNEANKPVVAVTMGDPNGVGPEITVRAVLDPAARAACRPLLIGSAPAARRAAALLGLRARINAVGSAAEAAGEPGVIDILETGVYDEASLNPGSIQELAGRMAVDFINTSIELGLRGEARAVATAPINKQAIRLAGATVPGHTELFELGTGSQKALTMFQCGQLRVFFLSRHVSLMEAIALVRRKNIVRFLVKANAELLRLGLREPSIAVAALNPHSGDNGLFGNEELSEILPAVGEARALGLRCEGPVSADSVFHLAKSGRYDAVLSLYHDQGHIACKTLDFERTVALTLGLPFLRTSVDHGTAFDLAWTGVASPISMIEAILTAAAYAPK